MVTFYLKNVKYMPRIFKLYNAIHTGKEFVLFANSSRALDDKVCNA